MIAIPQRFIIDTYFVSEKPIYKISPPESRPELDGYVLYTNSDTTIFGEYIFVLHGNEKRNDDYLYMYEHEEKLEGHPFPRYRYSEEQMYKIYGTEGISFWNYAKEITFSALHNSLRSLDPYFSSELFRAILKGILDHTK